MNSIEIFHSQNNPEKPSKHLNKFLGDYKKVTKDHNNDFNKLADMEEIIMQLRAKENPIEIKLSVIREYVYARSLFYRKGKKTKDIRIIVGKFDKAKDADPIDKLIHQIVDGKDMKNAAVAQNLVTKLMANENFVTKAKEKIVAAMEKEIENNIKEFNKKYN
jgi:hypothetical protein